MRQAHLVTLYVIITLVLHSAVQAAESNPAAPAGEPAAEKPDKSVYHLFNPTPKELLRELTTDRPDKTESPITIDGGHIQLEMDLITYTVDRQKSADGREKEDELDVAPLNLKLGLTNNTDIQLVFETHKRTRNIKDGHRPTFRQVVEAVEDATGGDEPVDLPTAAVAAFHTLVTNGVLRRKQEERHSGAGDLTLRLKHNFWGNDGGTTAFGIMPFVTIPTGNDNLHVQGVEGGVIVPFSFELPRGWDGGAMTEIDVNRDDGNKGYHATFVNSITFGHDIAKNLGGYVELYSEIASQQDARWIATFDLGLTFAVTENAQLDCGANIGLSKAADDCNLFCGLSVRF